MFNELGQWAQSTNELQAALSIAMQTPVVQVSTLTMQTANLQQNLSANAASIATAGPSGSICVKDPWVFTGKASEVETFLNEV